MFMSETFKTLNGLPAINLGPYILYKVVGMTDPIVSCCQASFSLIFQPNYSLTIHVFL